VRLISLLKGAQARELVGAASTVGSLESFLGHPDGREETVLLESVEHLDATTLVEDEAGAKYEAERQRPGLVIFTDGSHTEGGHRIRGRVEEGPDVEGTQGPHGSRTGSVQCGMGSHRPRP